MTAARAGWVAIVFLAPALLPCGAHGADAIWVGSASAEIRADDDMLIGGGIHPGRAGGQEGLLRATAIVVAPRDGSGDGGGGGDGDRPAAPARRVAIVSCDILMMRRDRFDEALERVEASIGIPAASILINATHTHHAPSTASIHAYERVESFCDRVVGAIVEAVGAANRELEARGPVELVFREGIESSVGQNSRLLLGDGTIYWTGRRDDVVRPTGPFDPELPVLAFREPGAGACRALLFNHSTHLIGTRKPGLRSPSFYGLAAQDLEAGLAEDVLFLSGAFGSTHNLTLGCVEMELRIRDAVRDALAAAAPVAALPIRSIKREFVYRVRRFDEAREERAVTYYCHRRIAQPESVSAVFRDMRARLAPAQGEERRTWIQALCIGEIALVTAPGELFTALGVDIKRRSPFRHTYVAGVANDYIGYIPDDRAYDLGGYQVWTGFHSIVERGTGERLVDALVGLLEEIRGASVTSR